MKTDMQLHQDVLAAFVAEPRLASANIGIAVKNGIITLSGFCESHAQKVVAEKLCARLTGVRGIAEEIQVNPPTAHRRTDEEIAGAVLNVLSWNTMVPANAISVKVEHGWITISGDVAWQYEKREAEKAIRYVQGMRGISNKITVTPKATNPIKDHFSMTQPARPAGRGGCGLQLGACVPEVRAYKPGRMLGAGCLHCLHGNVLGCFPW